jgi:protein ImuB
LVERPDWRDEPVVVVEADAPAAKVLFTNRAARRLRIHPGMQFAQAQSLTARLRATAVPPRRIHDAVDALLATLLSYSPVVAPERAQPGLFWLDPAGLQSLYSSLESWAAAVHGALPYAGAVVVGFNRLRCLAVARTRTGAWVLTTPEEERRLSAPVPLRRLSLPPALCDRLALLGVHTLRDLLALPAGEVRARLGADAVLHDLANGRFAPLQGAHIEAPLSVAIPVEPPEDNHARLLFLLKRHLHSALDRLAARCEALTVLTVGLTLEQAAPLQERIETAAPSLDVVRIADLVRLRLARLCFAAPVTELRLTLDAVQVRPEQLALLQGAPRRDLQAAGRAVARVNAAFGVGTVVRAELRPGHLPEAQFHWIPVREVQLPVPPEDTPPPLLRLLLPTPQRLPSRPQHEPERWLGDYGPVLCMHGPYRISGGWWRRPITRDYHYIETRTGNILWVFYDRERRLWCLQGSVE